MESRARDIEMISAVKLARDHALEKSRLGKLSSVLEQPSDHEKLIYCVKLLDVHPRLGKVAGRRLLSSLGVSQFDCVGDLDAVTIDAILREVGEKS